MINKLLENLLFGVLGAMCVIQAIRLETVTNLDRALLIAIVSGGVILLLRVTFSMIGRSFNKTHRDTANG